MEIEIIHLIENKQRKENYCIASTHTSGRDVTNCGEETQMLLKNTQTTTSCHINEGEGERRNLSAFSVHLSFYKLFPSR